MQKQEEGLLSRCQNVVRRAVLALFGNEGLFLLMAFLYTAVLDTAVFHECYDQVEAVYRYILVPWNAALCALRLQKRAAKPRRTYGDATALFLLYAWLTISSTVRFGMAMINLRLWFDYGVVFFSIYVSTSEKTKESRERMLAFFSGALTVAALIWSICLLYCALSGEVLAVEDGGDVFGVMDGCLYAGTHYNTTGMTALSLCMMCLTASEMAKKPLLKVLCFVPAVTTAAVIVLTQSRTSRYALLIALAFGTFGLLCRALASKGKALSRCVALVCAAVVLFGGYELCTKATDAALAHYMRIVESRLEEDDEPIGAWIGKATVPNAPIAIEDLSAGGAREEGSPLTARPGMDSTFSDRTNIWKNVFELWKTEPLTMLVGNGIGQTGSKIVKGTIHEQSGSVSVHNAYLQFAADFGLIGFALEAVFLVLALVQAARVFFAKERMRGALVLCMTVVAVFAVGMMESAPLSAMTPINITFMFVLAQLAGMSREIVSHDEGLS